MTSTQPDVSQSARQDQTRGSDPRPDCGHVDTQPRTRLYLVGQGPYRVARAASQAPQTPLPLTWQEPGPPAKSNPAGGFEGPVANTGPGGPQAALGQIGLLICDVLAGKRPVSQLNRLVTSDCLRKLQRRSRTWRKLGQQEAPLSQCGLQSVRWQASSAESVEATLITRVGPRYRAIAIQLIFRWNRWVVNAVETG